MTNIAEPTPEMIEAGVKAWYDTDHEGSTVGQSVRDIYTAMVASAPQEPDDALTDEQVERVAFFVERSPTHSGRSPRDGLAEPRSPNHRSLPPPSQST